MGEDIHIEIVKDYQIVPKARRLPFVDASVVELRQIGEFYNSQPLVFMTAHAMEAMEKHTQSQTRGEVGGLVIGDFCIHGDLPFTWVEHALPAYKAIGTGGGLSFTPESIEEVDREREKEYPHLRPVGWYHSHPSFGIFLSGTDLHTHRTTFKDGPYVAIVLDPVRKLDGVFSWVTNDIKGPLAYWVVRQNRS